MRQDAARAGKKSQYATWQAAPLDVYPVAGADTRPEGHLVKSIITISATLVAAGLAVPAARADYIQPLGAPGMCLNMAIGGVSIRPCDGSAPQDILISGDKYGGYYIVAGRTCLRITDDEPPQLVTSCGELDAGGKHFMFGEDGSISAQDYCLDVKGGRRNAGTPVIAFRCNGQQNQRWQLVETGTTIDDQRDSHAASEVHAAISPNNAPGLCLDSDLNGSIVLQPCGNAPAFNISTDGSMTQVMTDDDQCLTPSGPGQPLYLGSCQDGGANWGLTPNGLLRHTSGLCADVERSGNRPGTRVLGFKCSGNPNQRFTLIQ